MKFFQKAKLSNGLKIAITEFAELITGFTLLNPDNYLRKKVLLPKWPCNNLRARKGQF